MTSSLVMGCGGGVVKGGTNAAPLSGRNRIMVTVKWCQGETCYSSRRTLLYAGCPVARDDVGACALKAALGVSEIVGLACESGLLLPLSIRERSTFSLTTITLSPQFNNKYTIDVILQLHQRDDRD